MPMTPPANGSGGSEADVEAARQAADGQSSGQTDVAPKKTAPVVLAAIAEEQRQVEMDFGSQVADAEAAGVGDEAQLRSAVDGLDDMEGRGRGRGMAKSWLLVRVAGMACLSGRAESRHSLQAREM